MTDFYISSDFRNDVIEIYIDLCDSTINHTDIYNIVKFILILIW